MKDFYTGTSIYVDNSKRCDCIAEVICDVLSDYFQICV